MDKVLINEAIKLNQLKNWDTISVSFLNFNDSSFEFFSVDDREEISSKKIFYDLASLTKPLTNSFYALVYDENHSEEKELLLNHRGGIPAWGILGQDSWREQILSYTIKESETVYSDFGAIRYFLECEKEDSKVVEKIKTFWDKEVYYWLDREWDRVHDPNAFNLKTFLPHAGCFSTIEGLSNTLINFNKNNNFLDKMNKDLNENNRRHRFVKGFDTVGDIGTTLAGSKADLLHTFGHLGFTGTSFWIDSKKKVGVIILSNATKYYWYDKKELNDFRRVVGDFLWQR